MKRLGFLLAAVAGFVFQATLTPASAQTVAAATAHRPHHLVYQFGLNTPAAAQGQGTGTSTIDILGPAADGGVMIRGQDDWWHTARPRATNTCDLHPNGTVACTERPYAISPIQVTIFPLLAHDFFKNLTPDGTNSWDQKFSIKAALIPGGEGFSGNLYTWKTVMHIAGKGKASDSHLLMMQMTGTLKQDGGRYYQANVKAGIGFDPNLRIPVFVSENRSKIPQTTVKNTDLVQMKLIKQSADAQP